MLYWSVRGKISGHTTLARKKDMDSREAMMENKAPVWMGGWTVNSIHAQL